jgi:hypothetical protein
MQLFFSRTPIRCRRSSRYYVAGRAERDNRFTPSRLINQTPRHLSASPTGLISVAFWNSTWYVQWNSVGTLLGIGIDDHLTDPPLEYFCFCFYLWYISYSQSYCLIRAWVQDWNCESGRNLVAGVNFASFLFPRNLEWTLFPIINGGQS